MSGDLQLSLPGIPTPVPVYRDGFIRKTEVDTGYIVTEVVATSYHFPSDAQAEYWIERRTA